MRILAVDTSSITSACAICEDEKIIAEYNLNTGFKHSVTMAQAVESSIKLCGFTPADIDIYACVAGPGSFTGLRIGMSMIKAMADALDKRCISLSTLEVLAYNFEGLDVVVCPVLDAKRSQYYTALFKVAGENITRLNDDEPLSAHDIKERLKHIDGKVVLVGDGAVSFRKYLGEELINVEVAQEALLYTRGASLVRCAHKEYLNGNIISSEELVPSYHRLSQAERELKNKEEK